MSKTIDIFKGKTLEDLYSEIYSNSVKNKNTISSLILQLQPLVTQDEHHSAKQVVPLIKDYLDVMVRNDEHLIKLAGIVQKFETSGKSGGIENLMEELGIEDLMNESQQITKDLGSKK